MCNCRKSKGRAIVQRTSVKKTPVSTSSAPIIRKTGPITGRRVITRTIK